MALFHVGSDGLVPLHPMTADSNEEGSELGSLLWRDLDAVLAERLFRIRFGPSPVSQDQPAIFALDASGSVVVVAVHRVMGSGELSAALSCIGWARTATVSEFADLHWRGAEDFWRGWRRFSGAAIPPSTAGKPRLVLVSTDVTPPAASAIDFLSESALPVTVMSADIYQDPDGRQLLEISERDQQSQPEGRRAADASRGSRQRTHTSGPLPQLSPQQSGSLPSPIQEQPSSPPSPHRSGPLPTPTAVEGAAEGGERSGASGRNERPHPRRGVEQPRHQSISREARHARQEHEHEQKSPAASLGDFTGDFELSESDERSSHRPSRETTPSHNGDNPGGPGGSEGHAPERQSPPTLGPGLVGSGRRSHSLLGDDTAGWDANAIMVGENGGGR